MISREDLLQYSDSVDYLELVKERKARYEKDIERLKKRIAEIEDGEVVKDSVKGGSGGIQTYKIEGFPSKEYSERKTRLLKTRLNFENAQAIVEREEQKLSEKISAIEKFLESVDDNRMKQIITLRCIDRKNWNEIADFLGGMNNEDAVRMSFNRFVEKNGKNY